MERPSYRLQAAMLTAYLLTVRIWFKRTVKRIGSFRMIKEAHLYAMSVVRSIVPKWGLTLESDTGAGKMVGMAIGTIISVLMLPPVTDTIMGVNTTAWTFTGHEGVIAMMYIIPLVYIAAVIISIVRAVL
ncbi:hypothetical protein MUP46_03745 [Patescibacteria group bacterium]|nr:hypothetical protein [Patescibacteria group bacterium]